MKTTKVRRKKVEVKIKKMKERGKEEGFKRERRKEKSVH
jgi:hypothetical protein